MTSSNAKKDLPPNWIVKTSRHYPSLSFYANVKTGQSSWKHPSLLKESELKGLAKVKRKKKSKEISSEEVIAATRSSSDVVKQEGRPHKKAKFSPLNSEQFAASQRKDQEATSQSNDEDSASQINTQAADSTEDHKALKGKEKLDDRSFKWKTLEKNQESNNTSEDYKPKPIKFTIKKKNVLCISSVMEGSPKQPVTVHPSIILARKIGARDHMKTKGKNQDGRKETVTKNDVQTAKIKGVAEKASEFPAAATESNTSKLKSELKNRALLKPYEVNESMSEKEKRKGKGKERQKNRSKTSLSNPDAETTDGLHETDKIEVLLDTSEQKKDIIENRRKEDKMYEDFIKQRSKKWKKSRYKSKDSIDKITLKSEVSSDEEHSKSLSENLRPEQPKEEALEDRLNSGLPSKQVPYIDSSKVFEPLPKSASTDDNTVYPKATDMEIDEEELITEIANFRDSASYFGLTHINSLSAPTAHYSPASIYFVVDTNVLIQDTDFLEQLKSSAVDGREIVVVVPYVALQEMDGLKKSASIGRACQMAVKWCNRHFEAQDPRVLGQTYSNYRYSLEKNKKANADDLVRDYCLFLADEGLEVCLLTNDVNLRNKAMMSSLSAISAKDLKNKLNMFPSSHLLNQSSSITLPRAVCTFEESQMRDVSLTECAVSVAETHNLKPSRHQASLSVGQGQRQGSSGQRVSRVDSPLPSKNSILHEKITTSLCHTLGHILQDVMKEVYEDLWLTIIKHKPPWSLEDVFACWNKHWIAVMMERFPSSMKELLMEVSSLLTSSQVDAEKLLKRVQFLYSHFESMPYSKHILPIQNPSDAVDMSEAPPACTLPHPSSLPEPHQDSALSGVVNVEKMINQVGAHITHFVALVLSAFGTLHKLPTLGTSDSMTPDTARTSGVNLHQVIMSLGTAITKCLNEKTSAALQELGHLLVNFWSEAKLPCPHLPFTECDLRQFVENPSNMPFLEGALRELENLVQQLRQVLAGP
ncbi:transcriptional protein SWT1-like [Eriocheir sinensis]|uniref:transcriptional protein SWT1-like n=1 Tax=Eriocheir sinensis TaxID=95602 RepID=UPI0021C5A20A|nr:transcriptional protein SWT1-like [Eriocheir sinensis]